MRSARRPDVALAKVKAAFEAGPPALLVIDNIDDPALLTAQARERALPKGDHIHVLVTTRVSPEDLPRIRCLPLDALQTEDAMALLQSFRPIVDTPQDDEWKAALEIVGRLGGHALAVEVVAVYLRENPDVSYRVFAEQLRRDGIELIDTTASPEARGKLAWHAESCIARLLEPTLVALAPAEIRAVEYAALLPPDSIPLPWLRDLLTAEFPELNRNGLGDPVAKVFQRLERLRLIVSQARDRGSAPAADTRLARTHRLVQDVERSRLGVSERSTREARHQRLCRPARRHAGETMGPDWSFLGAASAAQSCAAANRPGGPGRLRPGKQHRDAAPAHWPHARRPRALAAIRDLVRATT